MGSEMCIRDSNFNLVKDYLLVAASNPDGIVRKEGSLLKMPLRELWYIKDAVYKLNRKIEEQINNKTSEGTTDEASVSLPEINEVMFIVPELDEEEEPSIASQ